MTTCEICNKNEATIFTPEPDGEGVLDAYCQPCIDAQNKAYDEAMYQNYLANKEAEAEWDRRLKAGEL